MRVLAKPPNRSRWLVTAFACGVALASAGCASARTRKENALALAADTKVLEGCYDCLQDARRTFERLTVGKTSKGSPAIVARLFETDILIALREKELGLDSRGAMEHARALAPPPLVAYRAANCAKADNAGAQTSARRRTTIR